METEPNIETTTLQQPPTKPVQTITKTPPPRVKNPKRVAQGKKLAAISKAAKLRKKERIEKTEKHQEEKDEISTTSMIAVSGTILGTVCTLLLTYIAYSQWTKDKTDPKETLKKFSTKYHDLSKYDL